MHPMDENLVGYLLDALDEDTRRETDSYLRSHPEGHQKLARLRAALAPLAADREPEPPPPGLVESTLARMNQTNRLLPYAPRTANSSGARGWWRRSEVIAASVLALVLLGMAAAWLGKSWKEAQLAGCKENLRELHAALVLYSEQRPDSAFPRVEETGPRSYAGMFVPMLADAGVLPEQSRLVCPACGSDHPSTAAPPGQLRTLEEWYSRDRPRFERAVADLAGSYAYSLGYRDERGVHGLRCGAGMDLLPIAADRPPFDGKGAAESGNSLNHGRKGQNVLFVGGAVRFVTTRGLGAGTDDIYLNQNRLIRAGMHEGDCVLGAGDASP